MKRVVFFARSFFFCSLVIFLASCASSEVLYKEKTGAFVDSLAQEACAALRWKQISPCASYARVWERNIPLCLHLVRVDLSCPSLVLSVYPDDASSDFFAEDVAAFAKKNSCDVAMNAGPFDIPSFGKRRLLGVHALSGVSASALSGKYACLGFETLSPENGGGYAARVFGSQREAMESSCTEIFGAYYVVLKNGEEIPFARESLDSRCAAGVADGGRTLYLLYAEGESRSVSVGLSFQQCARIFKVLSCQDALEFDGGSSASLYVRGESPAWGSSVRAAEVFGLSFSPCSE